MDYIIFLFIFFIFIILIVYGLPFKRLNFNSQVADIQAQVVRENFKTSSNNEVEQGASTFYDWGLRKQDSEDSNCQTTTNPPVTKKPHSCSGPKCLEGNPTYIENDYYIYPERDVVHEKADCSKCDAYRCKNIDRYVLKSSVPPCPDLSKYAPKSMVKTCPDMSLYIKKSEIPPCPKCPDMRNYVRKSQIPVCPPPVVCPQCPVCPPTYKRIQDDPRFDPWLKKYENKVENQIEKLYIGKKECEKISDNSYKKGKEDGKREAFKKIAKEASIDLSKTKQFEKCLKKFPHSNQEEEEYERPTITTTTLQPVPSITTTPPITTTFEPLTTMPPVTTQKPHHHPHNHHHHPHDHHSHNHHHHPHDHHHKKWNGKTNGECDKREFVPGWDPIDIGFGPVNKSQKILTRGCKNQKNKYSMGNGLAMTNPVSPSDS